MSMSQQTSETGAAMSAKVAPPAAVVGANIAGMPVADWVQYATLIYVVMMIAHKGWQMWKEWKTGKESKGDA